MGHGSRYVAIVTDMGQGSQAAGHGSQFRWVTGSWVTLLDPLPALVSTFVNSYHAVQSSKSHIYSDNGLSQHSINVNNLGQKITDCTVLEAQTWLEACLVSAQFLPRDAMHSADHAIARCLSVRLLHASILPKRLNI